MSANAKPKILHANILDDAILTATDTESGYDVNNIIDLRTYTFHKFNAAGTKYITGAMIESLLDEDCEDISDWTDGDYSVAVSEVDPAGQFRFDTNMGVATNAYAFRYRDIGSIPDKVIAKIQLYHDDLGSVGGNDRFEFIMEQAGISLLAKFAVNGLFVYDGASNNEIGTDLVKCGVSAEWQTWMFVCDFSTQLCDIYLDDSTHSWEKVGTDIDFSYTGSFTDGAVRLVQYGSNTDNMITHVDYVKIYTEKTAKTAGALGIVGHNLGTSEATVSVESSNDGITWTERLAGFQPSDDTAIMKEFTPVSALYWRTKIVTASAVVQLAVVILGEILTFERWPLQNFDPFPEKLIADTKKSKTGNLLGNTLKYTEIQIKCSFGKLTPSWVSDTFNPVWDSYLSQLKPFFWAWDITNHADEVFFVRIPANFSLSRSYDPVRRSLSLTIEGIKE